MGKIYFNPSTINHFVELRDGITGITGTNVFDYPELNGGTDTFLVANLPQTMTNKTFTGTTNTIRATQLGVTGGNDVIIGNAVAPSANMALISTGSTGASWRVVPGTYYQTAGSTGISTTTSASFVNKLTMTTPSLPSGTYRIGWQFSWRLSSVTLFFTGRVQIGGVTFRTFTIQPEDIAGVHPVSGFYNTGTISGVQTITIDFLATGGATASISDAALEIWRIV